MSARLERLMNLLAALIDTERPLSRSEIYQRVPGYPPGEDATARRAFERDKESLRNMGIPVTTEALDPAYPELGDGYRIPPESYYLPDPGLTRDEMGALALAASAVKLQSQSAAAALWKLGGDPHRIAQIEDVEVPESDELEVIFAARREHRTIHFTYKAQERSLDPYRLTLRNGRWYVNGFDHGHNDVRTYRLDRMIGTIRVGEPNAFPAPQPVDQPWLPPWQMGEETPIVARVFVDADQAELAIAQAGVNSIAERHPSGATTLQLTVTNVDALRSFVLGFLDHAEVLAPQSLRDEFIAYLRELTDAR